MFPWLIVSCILISQLFFTIPSQGWRSPTSPGDLGGVVVGQLPSEVLYHKAMKENHGKTMVKPRFFGINHQFLGIDTTNSIY
jgi:hypothetical protein